MDIIDESVLVTRIRRVTSELAAMCESDVPDCALRLNPIAAFQIAGLLIGALRDAVPPMPPELRSPAHEVIEFIREYFEDYPAVLRSLEDPADVFNADQ